MGHWAEILLPIYSLLSSDAWRDAHKFVDTIVFGNLQRQQLEVRDCWPVTLDVRPCIVPCSRLRGSVLPGKCRHAHIGCASAKNLTSCETTDLTAGIISSDGPGLKAELTLTCGLTPLGVQKLDWVWEMLKLVFEPATAPGQELPHAVFYDDFGQVDRKEWLCFEEVVVINDRRTIFWPTLSHVSLGGGSALGAHCRDGPWAAQPLWEPVCTVSCKVIQLSGLPLAQIRDMHGT